MGDDFGIDAKGFEAFIARLQEQKQAFPAVAKKLMGSVGSQARSLTAKKAKQLVGHREREATYTEYVTKKGKTKRKRKKCYHQSVKRGKVWVNRDGYKVRVFDHAPIAHLLEYGHRVVNRNKKQVGFRKGKYVFEKAQHEITAQMEHIVEKAFTKILKKL